MIAKLLFDSTWHSLLLLSGYALGVVVALITGICIGWFLRRVIGACRC